MDDLDDSDLINEDNVDQLRKSWEIEDHWLLRRDFILAHKDKFAFDRLMCLAQLFVNVETLGNEYDISLMKQIRSLEEDVAFVKERRERKKELDLANKPKEKPKSNDGRGEKRKWQDDSYQQYHRAGRGRYDGGYNNNRQGQGQGYGQTYGQRGARQYSDSRQNYSNYNYNQSNYNQSSYSSNSSSYNSNYNNVNSRNNAWQSSGQQHYQQQSQMSQPSNRPQYSTSLPGSYNQMSSLPPPQQPNYQSNYYNDIPSYSTSSPPHSSSASEPTDQSNIDRRSAQSFF